MLYIGIFGGRPLWAGVSPPGPTPRSPRPAGSASSAARPASRAPFPAQTPAPEAAPGGGKRRS